MIKFMAYFSIIASLIGVSIFSIDMGLFQLSLFRLIIIFMVFATLIKILQRNGNITLYKKSNNNYSIMFMLIWLAYALLSLGWVKDYDGWFRAIYFLTLGVVCVILFNRELNSTTDTIKSFRFMSIMIIIHNLIGWYEINTGNYLFLTHSRIARYDYYNYPVSIFHNINDFATFMLFSIFILFICLATSKNLFWQVIWGSTIISSIYLLISTGSRANILGLILSVGVFVFLSIKNRDGRRYLLITLAVLFLIIIFIPNLIEGLMISDKLYFRFEADTGSDVIRANLIKNGLYFVVSTLGFGTGAGNIEHWMYNYSIYDTSMVTNIHNWWMEILTGYGVFIFILYIIFFVKLFLSLYRRYRVSNNKADKAISLGIICSIVGFLIGSVSSSSNISTEWLWVFWGIVIAYQGLDVEKEKSNSINYQLYY